MTSVLRTARPASIRSNTGIPDNELIHKVLGTIDTREKFEAQRRAMAERVSARRHEKAFKQGETCVDCHRGIAQHLPQGYEEEQEASAGT